MVQKSSWPETASRHVHFVLLKGVSGEGRDKAVQRAACIWCESRWAEYADSTLGDMLIDCE
jgi:hypothetical protein